MKDSIKRDSEIVEEFITMALDKLKTKPKSMEEMSIAKTDYFELKGKKKEM